MIKNLINQYILNKEHREVLWSFASKGITFILFYAFEIFLANNLSVEIFGQWSFLFSALNLILILSVFGVNASSRKYYAQYNKTSSLNSVITSSFKLRTITSFIITIIYFFLCGTISNLLKVPHLKPLFQLATPIIFFYGLTEYSKGAFIGLLNIRYNFFINIIEYGLKFLLVVILFTFAKNISKILISFNISYILAAIIGIFFIFKKYYKPKEQTFKNVQVSIKDILKYSIPHFLGAISYIIFIEIDTLMLGLLSSKYNVGIYTVAKKIIVVLPNISLAIAMGKMAAFAKINDENRDMFKKKFYGLLKFNGIIFAIISIGLLASSWFIIPFLFGIKYTASIVPLLILIPFLYIESFSIFINLLLDYQALATKKAINFAFALIINIILNYFFIKKWGTIGAAIATSVSIIPYIILNLFVVKKVFTK